MKTTCGILILLMIALSATSQVKMKRSDGGMLFTENNKNVLFYQMEPKNKDGQYERCNYIHPLWSLNGTVLTEDFPADHLHQRGIFWAWHQIWQGNNRLGDGWEIKDFEQEISEVEFISDKSGAAIFKTEVLWKSDKLRRLGSKVPYLRENTTITIYPEGNNSRKIDFEIHLLALEDSIKIGGSEDEKRYGGFSVRMVLPDDVTFTGEQGEIKPQENQMEVKDYVNVSGTFGEKSDKGGIVIADNSENPGYPQNWILREKNSMQNVVFPKENVVDVSKTDPIVLKYSLIIYSGKMNDSKIQKIIK